MFLYELDDLKWNSFLLIRRKVFQKTTTNHVFLLGFFGMGCYFVDNLASYSERRVKNHFLFEFKRAATYLRHESQSSENRMESKRIHLISFLS